MKTSLCRLCMVLLCGGIAWAQQGRVVYNETEANDSKTAANVFPPLVAGDAIQGVSTSSTGTGLDYFRVKTAPLPLGIYQHRLVITTSGTAGHTGTIRGLTQSAGVISPTSDAALQTSSTSTTPPRMNQWYGFGKEEEIYYRVTGTTSTTAPYLATLFTSAVTVTPVPGTFVPGSITISAASQGHTTDTDLWVYDANLNAIVDYGNDDKSSLQSVLTRTYAPGTYYVAISNTNLANNLASPADDNYRSGNVMDFANSAADSSTSTALNLQFSITDLTGVPVVVANTKTGPFDINWFRFVVVAPSTGACCYPNGHCAVTTAAACLPPAIFHPGAPCGTVLPAQYHWEHPMNVQIPPGLPFEHGEVEDDSTPIGTIWIDLQLIGILGPLHIEIEHLGTTVVLWDGVCQSSDGMDVIFDDDGGTLDCANLLGSVHIRPSSAGGGLLSDFRGLEFGGPWIIRIYSGQYVIILVRWSIYVQFLDATYVCVPVPMGACCLEDGTCVHVSQADCTAQGGSLWQYAVPCSYANCPQPQPGDNCTLPLVVDLGTALPYTDANTTCGRKNDYSNTCLGSYDGGEDIIYELYAPEPMCLDVTVTGATSSDNWIGVLVDDSCPPDPNTCLAKATTSGTVGHLVVDLPTAGVYYLMVDTFPAPNCINFTLNIFICPRGACCLITGACLPNLTQSQCTTAGGIEWHVGVDCLPVNPCPQPPVNDDCPNALTVTDGTPAATGNNALASATDWAEASCQSSSNKDVWYAYTAPCTGAVVMDTEGSTQTDTVLSVYASCAGPEIACDDDSGTGNLSSLTFAATAGTTYYVRVASYSTGSGGFNLNIAHAPCGACCVGSVCTPNLTALACTAQSGIWQGAGSDCFPNPCVPLVDYYWDTTTGELGGTGYNGQWIEYPNAPDGLWYNMWWPNEFAPDRQKQITITFTLVFPVNGYLQAAWVWATPDWTLTERPPLADEEQYIRRQVIETFTLPGTFTRTITLPFCPRWISIDVRGDGYAIQGTVQHICLPPVTGACCVGSVCHENLTEAACIGQGGIWKGAGSDCFPNPCVPIDYYWDVTTGELGGNGYNGQWIEYPYAPGGLWYNMWWPNEFATDRQKQITITFDLEFPVNGYLEAAWVWATPDWTLTGRPPLADEEQFIQRQVIETFTLSGRYTRTITLPFCPSWISLDVRGNGYAIQGAIQHICLPPAYGVCCYPDGSCAVTTQADCLPPGVWHPEWTSCDPNPCPPANDNCPAQTPVSEGVYNFDTTNATFDGPGWCMNGPNIWYCYTPTCSGLATVSLVGSSYNTMLGVYHDCYCYPAQAMMMCCHPTICTIIVQAGHGYLIEVGGVAGAAGPGVLTITCNAQQGACCFPGSVCQIMTPQACAAALGTYKGNNVPCSPNPCLCPGDLNCDGLVNFRDINPFVLILSNPSAWQQTYPTCPLLNGDTSGDGSVNFRDINPFVALLSGGGSPVCSY